MISNQRFSDQQYSKGDLLKDLNNKLIVLHGVITIAHQ